MTLMTRPTDNGTVIHEGPMVLGGETVTSYLPEGYSDACAIICEGSDKLIGVATNPEVGRQIARYATMPDGGFGSVRLEPSSGPAIFHSLVDFI